MDNIKERVYKEILPFVSKPSRYIGKEFNSIEKKHDSIDVKVLLAFPELYEIGMSYLGFKILHWIINSRDDALAERVFSPWVDMENMLKKSKIPLCSLETWTPIRDFDIIGFTLQYEMTFTNILQILDLGGIPFYARDRGEDFPIIIGGGPVAYNPEPLSNFFDAFLIGEGEDAINEIIDKYKEKKKNNWDKIKFLEELTKIEGIYVPQFYDVTYNSDGTIENIAPNRANIPERIKKRIVLDFNKTKFPTRVIVPFINVVQDRINLEILRGCTHGCRFCMSGLTSRPLRERKVNDLVNAGKELIKNTGYDEISLSSLSSTDHSEIKLLVSCLNNEFKDKKVSWTLPSSRIDAFSLELADALSAVRKSTLTFAIEAGTERLRNVINKIITEDELLNVSQIAFKSGWNSIKLYFMLGLPTETESDVLSLVDVVKKINQIGRETNKRFKGVTTSVAFFVPKPHTPFCWESQESMEDFKNKIDKLRLKIKSKWLKWHSVELSFLEGVLARGDRKLSEVICKAYEKGARFDAWSEVFKFKAWQDSFEECKIDPKFYANRRRDYNEVLPWGHIDIGVRKEFLINENEKAKRGEISLNCKTNTCLNCGLEDKCGLVEQNTGKIIDCGLSLPPTKTDNFFSDGTNKKVSRIRIKYSKGEEIKFISHLDMVNTIQKMLARTKLPLVFTSGFNPHVKISFSPALPVGVSSVAEYFEIELYRNEDLNYIKEVLQRESPAGIEILEILKIPVLEKMHFSSAIYETDVGRVTLENLCNKVDNLQKLELKDNKLKISINLSSVSTTNIFKILEKVLNLSDVQVKSMNIKRIGLMWGI
ncbi:MAG: TIGR03960 family B12-binding radical SAM protein [Candidatus Firestonebacteria bacterium]